MTAAALAADEDARSQIREALTETLFVEAGAGTGKTSALVDRFVALVLAGHAVERLAAITFTEKAAGELRDRVRGELERRAAAGVSGLDAAIAGFDRAAISTIHAFAADQLRSFAIAAGIDPAFAVQDEVASERRFEERWRGFLEDLAGDANAIAAIDGALALGLTTAHVSQLAHTLWSEPGAADTLRTALPIVEQPAWPDLEALWQRLEALPLDRVVEGDYLLRDVRELQRFVTRLTAATTDEERRIVLAGDPHTLDLKFGYGRAASWPAGSIETARTLAREIVATLKALLEGLRSAALAALLPQILRFVADDEALRCREGKLRFDDLILRLRNVLRDSAAAREALRRRFDALLIDEFQDTDPLQVDIALAFATDPATRRLEPGRLFVVGDPKQSIYRFRRADMAVYGDTLARVEAAGGRFPALALNRRSRPPIIDWVNRVFAPLIGDGRTPALQPPYRRIEAARDDVLAGPAVAWLGSEIDATAREIRQVEARQVAAQAMAAVATGWQVADRDGAARPARYRDIAILVPTRALLAPLEGALGGAGIPYRVEGGSLVYGTQEVRDLLNCLTAIDDPSDEVAVVGALRSPAYACSDVELTQHRLGGGSFSYLSPQLIAGEGRVVDALLSLRAWHETRQSRGLAALVERFLADRRLVEIGLIDAGNRNAYRRARFVVEQARAFEADGPASLRAFVAWLEQRAGDAILDHEGAGLDDDEDAVRILTVHAAKGLEFPIVFLAGLGIGPPPPRLSFALDRATGAVALSAGSGNARFTLGPYADLYSQERAQSDAERDRLLYVAATRARDHLVVCLYRRVNAACPARRLVDCSACDGVETLAELPLPDSTAPPLAGLNVELPDVDETAFGERRTALVATTHRLTYTSATALMQSLHPEAADIDGDARDDSEPWKRGRGGTHRGRAVHAALQSLPWDADDALIAAVAAAEAVAEAVPDEKEAVARLVRAALGTEAAGRARAASRALREVPFAFPAAPGGTIVEGFIDVVIETADGLEIVDWKTDAVPPSGVAARLHDYELQAGLYVLGLEAATLRPVTRVTYVFLDPLVEREPGAPAQLAAQAEARLALG